MLLGVTSSCVSCGSPTWKPPLVNVLGLFLRKDSSLPEAGEHRLGHCVWWQEVGNLIFASLLCH